VRRSFLPLVLAAAAAVVLAQATLTNADVIKLVKAGMSEDFILNLVQTQGSRLNSDTAGLVEMKAGGVNERILAAIARKSPPQEKLNSDSVLRLVRAGLSEAFVIDLMRGQEGSYSVDAGRLVELKQAGVSERILSLMVSQSGVRELAAGSEISIRLIDPVDSERSSEGDEFRATLEDPITVGNEVVAPKGADAKVRLVAEKDSGKLRGRTELTVELMSVTVDGKAVPISTSSVTEYSGSRGARTAKSAAAVGAIGAVIGAIAGGGKGAAIGAAAGAGAGAGAQVFMRGQRVRIPSETVLTFITSAPARF
jgi:hypothetical protein